MKIKKINIFFSFLIIYLDYFFIKEKLKKMVENNKKILKFKIISLILYLVICIVSFPLLFYFHPKNDLFKKNSVEDEDKKYLFKNFVSEIYDNINKRLIKNITMVGENKECPKDFETFKIQHQYYGTFTHFFGNNKFCIQRYNNDELNFKRLLEKNEVVCDSGRKACGKVNTITNALVCINEGNCPLIGFELKNKGNNFASENFVPEYDSSNKYKTVIDIEIILKYYFCLEKFHRLEEIECEFVDDFNECFIEDKITSEAKFHGDIYKDYKLTPANLAKYNIKNYDSINHNYCVRAKANELNFVMFSKFFVNFGKDDLDTFLEEFPNNDHSDPLSKICNEYKSDKNFDVLFHYFFWVFICWSILQLILQILLFFVDNEDIKNTIWKNILYNGLILFIFKLICFGILIVNHYSFYLRFKDVYLDIDNDPRNKILNYYKSMRKIFITKIFIIWIAGFIIISIDLMIMCFVLTFHQKMVGGIEEKKDDNNNDDKKIDKPKEKVEIQSPFEPVLTNKVINKEEYEIKPQSYLETSIKTAEIIRENPYKKIELTFRIKGIDSNEYEDYKLKVDLKENLNNIEISLKKKYPQLERKNIGVIRRDSFIFNKEDSVEKNNIKNGDIIVVD